MKIIWYGHSCFRVEIGSSVILIDPFLKRNPTFEKSGIAWEEATKGTTHVALTHGHSDHAGDAGEICGRLGATLFANFELAMYMKSKGADKLEPMNTGGTVAAADFELTLTNALHSSSQDVYLGNPNGIVIRPKDGKTLYHMGDTEMFAGMGLIAAARRRLDGRTAVVMVRACSIATVLALVASAVVTASPLRYGSPGTGPSLDRTLPAQQHPTSSD